MSTPKVTFPRDDGVHSHIVEWWYFNGHLTTDDRQELAYMHCLFKVDNKKINMPFLREIPLRDLYFSHWQIANLTKNTLEHKINYMAWPEQRHQTKGVLDLEYIDYANLSLKKGYTSSRLWAVNDNTWQLRSAELDLTLDSQKPPLLEGGTGYVKNHQDASYYYSRTDLSTTGTVMLNGRSVKVKGKSWFDHQWANISFRPVKWNWFSCQFADGTDMVLYEYFDDQGRPSYLASSIDQHNRQRHTKKVSVTPGGRSWQSNKTKATYPLDWQVAIPEWNQTVEITATRSEQEMVFGSINYWEGPTKVVRHENNHEVTGLGYMELVGYPVKRLGIIKLSQRLAKIIP